MYTDHSAVCYLMSKKYAKPRVIRRMLLLQEFNFKMNEKRGTKNVVADHLSCLLLDEKLLDPDEIPIEEDLREEALFAIMNNEIPWFANYANYLACGIEPHGFNSQQRKRFFKESSRFN